MLIDVSISVAIALALIFVAESILRILYPEKVLEISARRRQIEDRGYRFQADYGVALRPNISKTFERVAANGGDVVHWKTNGDSFRGPEIRSQPELRVIVYGDSNIQARFSRLDQTFPYKLQEYLISLSGLDIEVLNGGVVGFGPDQVLIRFSTELDLFHPDIVVFHIFADNDLGDLVRNRLYYMDAQDRLISTQFTQTVDQQLEMSESPLLLAIAVRRLLHLATQNGAEPTAAEATSVAQRVADRLDLIDDEFAVYTEGEPRSFSHFADHYDFDVALHPDSESSTTKIALLNRVLKKAKAVCDEKDVELVVLIQPSSIDLTRNLSINYRHLERYSNYRRDRLSSIVDGISSKHEIHRVNLYPVFLENNPELLFFKQEDDHWNDAGQDLAARKTAEYIFEEVLTRRHDPKVRSERDRAKL